MKKRWLYFPVAVFFLGLCACAGPSQQKITEISFHQSSQVSTAQEVKIPTVPAPSPAK